MRAREKNAYALSRTFEEISTFTNSSGTFVNNSWTGIKQGHYDVHLKRWLTKFPMEYTFIMDGNMFSKNPVPILSELETFLGVEHVLNGKYFYFDKAKGFYCMRIMYRRPDGRHKFHRACLAEGKGRPHPEIDPDVSKLLQEYFRPGQEWVQKTTGKRLSWLDHTE